MSIAGSLTRTAAALVPRLSFPLASGLGRGLGSLAWALDGRHRDIAMSNLRQAFPELPESRRRRLALGAFQQAGRTAIEMLWSRSLDDRTLPQVAAFDGREHVDEALSGGQGVLLTTAHFGNWELMGVAFSQVGIPINVVARPIDDPGVEEILDGLRTRTGARVIPKENAVRAALRTLREGEVVGILIDQNTVPAQGLFVPFFGRLAATTRITAQLHVRTGAPILMAFCVPEGDRYRFVIEPLEMPSATGGDEGRVEELTAAMTRQIERHIRRHPGAWLWIHDRWRARPPHEGGAADA